MKNNFFIPHIWSTLLSLAGANAADNCTCNVSTPAGTKTKLYLAPVCEIDTMPDTIAEGGTPTTMGDEVCLDGDIVFDTTTAGEGYWREYDIIQYSGAHINTLVGEKGSRSFDNDIVFELAGTEKEQLGFAKCVANGCFVAMLETKSGLLRGIGDPENSASFESIVLNTGAASSDPNKGIYTLRSNDACPSWVYDGVIDVTPNP